MGSDDVRARAEAVARDLFTNGTPRRFAYLVLRDTPGNQPGEGGSWSEGVVADRIAAALAVAPATGDAAAVGIAGLDFHVPRDRTPSGYTRVEAYMGNGHVVVMGSPTDESHSCDALGCGSTGAHVIARLPLPAPATAVEEVERRMTTIPTDEVQADPWASEVEK